MSKEHISGWFGGSYLKAGGGLAAIRRVHGWEGRESRRSDSGLGRCFGVIVLRIFRYSMLDRDVKFCDLLTEGLPHHVCLLKDDPDE